MRTAAIHFFSLLSFVLLVSCGSGQKTSTKLEISRGFVAVNTGFGGGLIVTGKNLSNGEYFSQGLDNSMTLNYSLSPGQWEFSAIGWDGGGSALKFGGVPHCGITQASLSGTTATVSLSVAQETCGAAAFAGAYPDVSLSNTPTLRKLQYIIACNTLYTGQPNPGDIVASSMVSDYTAATYCDNQALDLKGSVRSIRIHSMSKTPEQSSPELGIMSPCIQSDFNSTVISPDKSTSPTNPYKVIPLRLPLKSVPLIIATFEDDFCTKPKTKYEFKDGLATSDPAFDHLLLRSNTSPTQVKLIIPATDLRRAHTSFAHLLPFFKKYNGTVAPFETVPMGLNTQYYFVLGEQARIKLGVKTCPTLTTSSNTISAPTCVVLDGEAVSIFQPNTTGNGYVTYGSSNYNFYAESSNERYKSNKILYRLLGAPSSTNNYDDFFTDIQTEDNEDSRYGALSRVRMMLTGDGPAGVLGIQDINQSFLTNCMNTVGEKAIQIFDYDEMRMKGYKVRITNAPITTPSKFICHNSNYDPSTCGSTLFNKRMLVWDYDISTVLPMVAMEFSCNKMIGKYQSLAKEKTFGGSLEAKTIVNWNTNNDTSTLDYQRFEFMENIYVKDASGTLTTKFQTMSRVQKRGPADADMWTFTYTSTLNSGTGLYDEIMEKFEQLTETSNKMCYYYNSGSQSGAVGSMFSTGSTLSLRTQAIGNDSEYNYMITDPLPQTVNPGACATSQTPVSDVNGGGKMNGSLDLVLESFNNNAFDYQFNGNFIAP